MDTVFNDDGPAFRGQGAKGFLHRAVGEAAEVNVQEHVTRQQFRNRRPRGIGVEEEAVSPAKKGRREGGAAHGRKPGPAGQSL
ncbi:hypothetical protein SDC9_176190 [bioreactor metagenome]|uniref:Uncharacterized protein n=1 Tax=bioreactor metagenome TaxID=1076179 RepID=A0A645GPZ6_9ZZZZ